MTLPLPNTTKKFAHLINQPGGATLAEATRAANANIEGIRDSALHEIGAILDKMYDLGAKLSSAPQVSILNELYDLSNTILSVAGVFGLAHVGAVAYSLCELIDRLRRNGRLSPGAVMVHLDSLRLMHVSPDDAKQAGSVQRALRHLVGSIPDQPA